MAQKFTVAGHTLTTKQMVALHGIYKGLVENNATIYGTNVKKQLDFLADKGIISRTGMGAYLIPFGSPGEEIVAATPNFTVAAHI